MFSARVLDIDARSVVEKIAGVIRQQILGDFERKGAAVGISGGNDRSTGSFSRPYAPMDLCLYAFDDQIPVSEVAPVVGLTEAQALHVFRNIVTERRATHRLHLPSQLVETL